MYVCVFPLPTLSPFRSWALVMERLLVASPALPKCRGGLFTFMLRCWGPFPPYSDTLTFDCFYPLPPPPPMLSFTGCFDVSHSLVVYTQFSLPPPLHCQMDVPVNGASARDSPPSPLVCYFIAYRKGPIPWPFVFLPLPVTSHSSFRPFFFRTKQQLPTQFSPFPPPALL